MMAFRSSSVRSLLALSLSAALVCLAGCSDDEVSPEPPPVVESPYPFPGSEDQLLANFRSAYEALDAAGVTQMLRGDSVTFLQANTQLEFPELGPTLDYAEEVRCAARMLGGKSVTDPDSSLVAGISSITFQTFERQGEWYTTSAAEPIVRARAATYFVTLLCDRPMYPTLKSNGQITFFAASRDSFHDGASRSYWQLVGQLDLTSEWKSIESKTWGSVKALFR